MNATTQALKLITNKKLLKTASYYALCLYFPKAMLVGSVVYKMLY